MRAIIGGSIASIALAGCVTSSVPHLSATAEVTQMVKAGKIAPDLSRIVAFKGQILLPANSWGPSDPATGDLLVNGLDIGGVNKGQAIAVDLAPATYSVSWKDVGDTDKSSPALVIPFTAGQIVYASMDRQMRRPSDTAVLGGMVSGVVGGAIDGAIVGAVAASAPDENYRGPILRLHADGSTLIQAMEIVGTTPAAAQFAATPRQ